MLDRNICIPVDADQGINSPVCVHVGSAPLLMIVDTDTGACRALPDSNLHHEHGMCQPLAALQGAKLSGIVVGGIGMGALNRLPVAGLAVYRSEHPTIEAALAAFKAGQLREMSPEASCGHHGRAHGPAHGRTEGHGHIRG